MRKLAMMALALMAAGGLAACSEEVDKEGTVDDLVESGMDREQAECLVDGLVEEFGDERALELNDADEELTAEEQEAMTDLTLECLDLGDLGSIPDVSIPDISIPDSE
jgi:hypothetical protein